MKRYEIICWLFILSCTAQAQTNLPDSIQAILSEPRKDSLFIIRLNNVAFQCLKSNPELGREVASRAYAIAREIDFNRGMARALSVTGSSFWVAGDYESALKYYQRAAKEYQNVRDSAGVSVNYHNIGEVFKKVGDYGRAIDFLTTSLEWDSKKRNLAITLYNIGEAHLLQKDFALALDYYNKSFKEASKEKNARAIAYDYHGMGLIEYENKRMEAALEYFDKAEKMWTEQGEHRCLIQTYQDFAIAYSDMKYFDKALQRLNMSVGLANKIHAQDLQITNYLRLSELYIKRNDFKKAWEAMAMHNALKDSLYNQKKTEHIARLQAEFEVEAREIENKQLKADQQSKNSQLKVQRQFIIGISAGLVIAAVFVIILLKQRKQIINVNKILSSKNQEISNQKTEIESQAQSLQKLNAELQSLNKHLETRIEERTHQLTVQNKKLAAYAFAHAHHLRAPVASILGLINLLERVQLSSEDKALILYMQQCAKELDDITKELSRNLEGEDILSSHE